MAPFSGSRLHEMYPVPYRAAASAVRAHALWGGSAVGGGGACRIPAPPLRPAGDSRSCRRPCCRVLDYTGGCRHREAGCIGRGCPSRERRAVLWCLILIDALTEARVRACSHFVYLADEEGRDRAMLRQAARVASRGLARGSAPAAKAAGLPIASCSGRGRVLVPSLRFDSTRIIGVPPCAPLRRRRAALACYRHRPRSANATVPKDVDSG